MGILNYNKKPWPTYFRGISAIILVHLLIANTMAQSKSEENVSPVKVNGFGGLFLKSADPKVQAKWYQENLGIGFENNLYFSFMWRESENADSIGRTTFCFFKKDSEYYSPSTKSLMLNFRVGNLDTTLAFLRSQNVEVIGKAEEFEYGKFGWAMDPDGRKLELWEPIEEGFGDMHLDSDLRSNVTGIGGLFVKSKDPKKLMEWYSSRLGISFTQGSHVFEWQSYDKKDKNGNTVFGIFAESSKYFDPSTEDYMINFRVKDLELYMEQLKKSGVESVSKIETYPYGKFGWILDSEGRKIEFWEPSAEEPGK